MAYLLDTNIVSEVFRPAPEPRVLAWIDAQSTLDVAISVLTLGEIERGILGMPLGAKRSRAEQWAHADLPRLFRDRLIPVDDVIALAWGGLGAEARRAGRPLPHVDGLLVATAQVHALTLVTRNVADCAGRGVPVLDPWTGTLHT